MEERVKISPKWIVRIAILLLILIAVLAWLNFDDNAVRSGGDGTTLTIYEDGTVAAVYSLSQLLDMPKAEAEIHLKSASASDENGRFQGVWLSELLSRTGVEQYETVIFKAGDGYASAASCKEAGQVLIAYSFENDTLGYYQQGGTGPLRAVFTKDTYGNRSVQYLIEIDIKTNLIKKGES